MSAWTGGPAGLEERQRAGVVRSLARWAEHHEARGGRATSSGRAAHLVDVEVLRAGRPVIIDVVGELDGGLVHAVLALHRTGDGLGARGADDELALGTVEDDQGPAVVLDALHDTVAAALVLEAVGGDGALLRAHPVVSIHRDDAEALTLAFDRRRTLTVFPWLRRGPHPGMTLLAGLDEAGFNHLPAPVAFWRRGGRDLGVVQELVAGSADGWALALTSLRDLFDAAVPPDRAGGDFAPESFALGTMAARMHLALERAFGARDLDDPSEPGVSFVAIRTHGDFHLGRTARSDLGWVLADPMPGGTDGSSDDPVFRCALADVADLCWSLGHAAAAAASERGLTGEERLDDLVQAWVARNRRAFLAAYLATPGIGALLPADRRVVRRVLGRLESARAARESDPHAHRGADRRG